VFTTSGTYPWSFNLRDTEVVICIILVILKRVDGLNSR
jgi:hypothetical protein